MKASSQSVTLQSFHHTFLAASRSLALSSKGPSAATTLDHLLDPQQLNRDASIAPSLSLSLSLVASTLAIDRRFCLEPLPPPPPKLVAIYPAAEKAEKARRGHNPTKQSDHGVRARGKGRGGGTARDHRVPPARTAHGAAQVLRPVAARGRAGSGCLRATLDRSQGIAGQNGENRGEQNSLRVFRFGLLEASRVLRAGRRSTERGRPRVRRRG